MSVSVLNTDAGLSGKTLVNAEDAQNVTGAKSFNRSPNPPFVVQAGSANVPNLDADKLDGLDSLAFVKADGTVAMTGDLKFTDATYDIGKSGATRPRDGFFSRNLVVGGTLGVTGVATFTAQSVHSAGIDISSGTAGRIVFPSAQNQSSNANTLDDYAEGSWTPVIGGSGGTSGQSYTVQVGTYIKIGRLVTVNFNVTLSAKGTITTDVQIQGLPFTIENTANYAPALIIPYWSNVAVAKVFIGGYGILNTTAATITGLAAAGGTHTIFATADIGNTTQFVGTFVYRATA